MCRSPLSQRRWEELKVLSGPKLNISRKATYVKFADPGKGRSWPSACSVRLLVEGTPGTWTSAQTAAAKGRPALACKVGPERAAFGRWSNLALIFKPKRAALRRYLTSSRAAKGRPCSPVVAQGDAYPPFEVKPAVGLRGQRPLPEQPGCTWEGGKAAR